MNGKAGQRGPKYHRALGGREAIHYKYTGQTAAHASLNKERMRNAETETSRARPGGAFHAVSARLQATAESAGRALLHGAAFWRWKSAPSMPL
jgi:hypothetical protein